MKKAGFRLDRNTYAELSMGDEIKLITDINGEKTEYDVTGGGASGEMFISVKEMPKTMSAGDTFQLEVEAPEDSTIAYVSSAPGTKIVVDENGLMSCIGSTTGTCGIDINGSKSIDGSTITSNIHFKVKVI